MFSPIKIPVKTVRHFLYTVHSPSSGVHPQKINLRDASHSNAVSVAASLVQLYLPLAATRAAVDCHQFSLFDIKLFGSVHHPLVMTVATQGITLVFFL
jgi:hypothetical protein